MNPTVPVWMATIHDVNPRGALAFDFKDLLGALSPDATALDWIVKFFECVGEKPEPGGPAHEDVRRFSDAVELTGIDGFRISGPELFGLADRFVQTLEGEFVGFPAAVVDERELELIRDPRKFPRSESVFHIWAVEGGYYVVWTKRERDVEALRLRFKDVRMEAKE